MKKGLAFFVALTQLLTLSLPAAAESDFPEFGRLIAEDSFSYDWGQTANWSQKNISEYDYGGEVTGVGFKFNWSASENSYEVPSREAYQIIAGRKTISKYDSAPIFRALSEPVSLSEGTYILTYSVQARPANDAAKEALDFRFRAGSEDLFFGMKYNDDLSAIMPQLSAGGDVLCGAADMEMNKYYTIKLEMEINDEREDAVRLKAYPIDESEPEDWDIETSAELSGRQIAWLGYSPCQSGSSSSRFTAVKFEYENQTLENRIREIAEKAAPTEEELRFAYAKLAKYPNGAEKDAYIAALNEKCAETGADSARYASVAASEPNNGETVSAADARTIKIEYDYLIEDGADFDVTIDGEAAEGQVSQNENKFEITLSEEVGEGKTVRVTPHGMTDYKGDAVTEGIEFTTSFFPQINIADGGKYGQGFYIRWTETEGDVYSAELDGEPIENGHRLMEVGNYVVRLTAQRGELTESREFGIEVTLASAPEARSLTIEGSIKAGNVLRVSYVFYDDNSDDEGESIIRLFAADDRVSEGAEITDRLTADNKFTVTEDLFGKYVYFTVKPISVAYPEEGEEAVSERFAMPMAPQAQGVMISGSGVIGGRLEAAYTYMDENGDPEGETVIEWKNAVTGKVLGTGRELTLENIAKGSTVVAVVTPKSTEPPYAGESVESNRIVVTDKKAETDSGTVLRETIAADGFSYYWGTSKNWEQIKMSEYDYQGRSAGTGFSFNWSLSPDSYKVPSADDFVYQIYSNRITISNPSPTPIYRALETPVNLARDGVYTFKITAAAVGTSDSHKTAADLRFMLGSDKLYMGYKLDSSLTYMVPQICVDGKVVLGNADINAKAPGFMDCVMEIETRSDGADTIRMKLYPNGGAEKETWDIEYTAELSSVKIPYIGYSPCQNDYSSSRFCGVSVSYFNRAMNDFVTAVSQNPEASESEVRQAFEYLGYYDGDSVRDGLIADLRGICTSNGYMTAEKAVCVSSKPENGATAFTHEIDEIRMTYDYMLSAGGSCKLYENGVLKDCSVLIDGFTVTVKPSAELKRGASVRVVPDGISDFKGDFVSGELEFRTSETPRINITDGGVYGKGYTVRYTETAGVECTLMIKRGNDDFAEAENGYVLRNTGEYAAVLTAGAETREIAFRVVEDIKPVASNLTITGESEIGAVIEGMYEFSDENSSDRESASVLSWYRKTENGLVKIGEGYSYTITSDDLNRHIVFSVIPMSDSEAENAVGDETFSEPFAAPFAPAAVSLSVSGKLKAGEVLTPAYTYHDENGDAESGTEIHWYAAADAASAGSEISSDGENGFSVTVEESLFGKYVYFTVTPKNEVNPTQGETVTSQRYLMPSAPQVSEVSISGTVRAGASVTAVYKYYDINGDPEGESLIVWKDSDGAVIGSGRTITLPQSTAGKRICVEVTAGSEQIPTNGNTAASAYVTVAASESGGGGFSGGGGGGGGGFALSGKNSGSAAEEQPDPDEDKIGNDVKKDGFSDIEGHWAKDIIEKLAEQGVISKDSRFRPEDSISRAEFLALIMRGTKTEGDGAELCFDDVAPDDWFAEYVSRALALKMISEDISFRPNDVISREEAAKLIVNILKISAENDFGDDLFVDFSSVSDWAKGYVAAAKASGLFTGDESGRFNPVSSLSRAEAAALTDRIISRAAEQTAKQE